MGCRAARLAAAERFKNLNWQIWSWIFKNIKIWTLKIHALHYILILSLDHCRWSGSDFIIRSVGAELLTRKEPPDLPKYHQPSSITSFGPQRCYRTIENQIILEENFSNFSVSTVLADGLAPLGDRASAGAVMMQLRSQTYMRLALQGLTHWGWDKMATILQTTFSSEFS